MNFSTLSLAVSFTLCRVLSAGEVVLRSGGRSLGCMETTGADSALECWEAWLLEPSILHCPEESDSDVPCLQLHFHLSKLQIEPREWRHVSAYPPHGRLLCNLTAAGDMLHTKSTQLKAALLSRVLSVS